MTNDKAQMSNQAIWPMDFEIWIFLNYLWPDFDVALAGGRALLDRPACLAENMDKKQILL